MKTIAKFTGIFWMILALIWGLWLGVCWMLFLEGCGLIFESGFGDVWFLALIASPGYFLHKWGDET